MAKKTVAKEVSPENQQTLRLEGKNVQKDLKVDDVVTVVLTGKVSDIGRERWGDSRQLYQTLLVTDLKKITKDSIDLDKVFPKKK